MYYDILNAADHPLRQHACPLVVREQLMMAFHSKSLSKRMQMLGYTVEIELLRLSYDKQLAVATRDVVVCRNQKPYIIARTIIPKPSCLFFEQRFSLDNQFPLGYFLFYGQGNIRTHFRLEISHRIPSWITEYYAHMQFAIIRYSRWQMSKDYFLDLEEVFL